ncbi:hypothetical protein Xaut_0240 [Xanthobacter versatilis]|uniref:Uncharacterized protein n=1 Tax=Xanthobacter autotrophicus (strain ATCC BAA-1158 / Py2) TaxID=78245 RepID=A7IBV5_XANP2|nr:hypothetical protein Xaut_0240 [Xanthobacter autotrophicus Py2]
MFDMSNLPLSGGLLGAAALYAGLSLFVTGPLVGERMVEKMDWAGTCAAQIRTAAEAQRPEATPSPRLDCGALLGGFLGRDGAKLCAAYGPLLDPIGRAQDAAEAAKRSFDRQRLEHAAAGATTRCDCASATTLENRRVALALHAGSARFITPPSIRTLRSDLMTSLASPACALKG